MSTLEQILKELTEQSRLEAIDASYNGSPIAQANHRVKFKGLFKNWQKYKGYFVLVWT